MKKELERIIEAKTIINEIKGPVESFKGTSNFERSKDAKKIVPGIEQVCEILNSVDILKLQEAIALTDEEQQVKNKAVEMLVNNKLEEFKTDLMDEVKGLIKDSQIIKPEDILKVEELTKKVDELKDLKVESENTKNELEEKDKELKTANNELSVKTTEIDNLNKELEPIKTAKGLKKVILNFCGIK